MREFYIRKKTCNFEKCVDRITEKKEMEFADIKAKISQERFIRKH